MKLNSRIGTGGLLKQKKFLGINRNINCYRRNNRNMDQSERNTQTTDKACRLYPRKKRQHMEHRNNSRRRSRREEMLYGTYTGPTFR